MLVILVEWMLEVLSEEKAIEWSGQNELTSVLSFPRAGHAS